MPVPAGRKMRARFMQLNAAALDREIVMLEAYIRDGGCCDNCAKGSGDCDVNPLAKPPTLEEAKVLLADFKEQRNALHNG